MDLADGRLDVGAERFGHSQHSRQDVVRRSGWVIRKRHQNVLSPHGLLLERHAPISQLGPVKSCLAESGERAYDFC